MDSVEDVEALRAGEVILPRERALVGLARRVVLNGGVLAGAEIAAARDAGLTDQEIVEAVTAAGLGSLFNAMAIAAGTGAGTGAGSGARLRQSSGTRAARGGHAANARGP